MSLPNGGRPVIKIAKLSDYSLNSQHPGGWIVEFVSPDVTEFVEADITEPSQIMKLHFKVLAA
jgi:hypothetical protein